MNREFLKELGLDAEVIDKVMAEHGKTVNSLKNDAKKVEGLESQVIDYKGQLKDRDTQLVDLKGKVTDNAELTKQINDLQTANQSTIETYEEKLKRQAFDFAVEREIGKHQAKNVKAVRALLDTEKIKLDGDNLIGLTEQVEELKKSDEYLFGADLRGRTPHTDPTPPPVAKNPWKPEHFNLTEQGRLLRSDPEKAKQLMQMAGK